MMTGFVGPMLGQLKLWLGLAVWVLAIPPVLGWTVNPVWLGLATGSFFAFLFLIALLAHRQSLIICGLIMLLAFFLLPVWPDWTGWQQAAQFVLVFACLMPTLALVRAVAGEMPSVHQTQRALAELPPQNSAFGLQLTSHVVGGVINTGTFALIAASLPDRADKTRRLVAGSAALRGMNSAVLWSPFFVSFAVSLSYLPQAKVWLSILLGIAISLVWQLCIGWLFAPPGQGLGIARALYPLRPLAGRLAFVMGMVVLAGFVFSLTALKAVVVVMPVLSLFQMARRPETIRPALTRFALMQKRGGDELLIISLSMMMAALATQSPVLKDWLGLILGETVPIDLTFAILPVFVWLASLVGVHPVISSAPLLALFAPGLSALEAGMMMQAHALGWAAGTMTSLSSLSIMTVSDQFRLRPADLILQGNLIASASIAAGGGAVLAGLHYLLF